jgi:hypothetical protein
MKIPDVDIYAAAAAAVAVKLLSRQKSIAFLSNGFRK